MLRRNFRESLISSSLCCKERRLEVRVWSMLLTKRKIPRKQTYLFLHLKRQAFLPNNNSELKKLNVIPNQRFSSSSILERNDQ